MTTSLVGESHVRCTDPKCHCRIEIIGAYHDVWDALEIFLREDALKDARLLWRDLYHAAKGEPNPFRKPKEEIKQWEPS